MAGPAKRRSGRATAPRGGARLAARVPLSHFPAGSRFAQWREWSGLASVTARGATSAEPTRHVAFKRLEDDHVFFFAGPCAYTRNGAVGDAALWMHPDVETDAGGGASPFDTGALEKGRLRPWQTSSPDERWAVHQRTERPLDGWRGAFGSWLDAIYRDPETYFDTAKGRRDSGYPDKGADPDGVFAVNGPKDPAGADRRAWTWEVRLSGSVALDEVEALLLPRRLAEDARAWRKARKAGKKPQLFFIERDTAVGADDVFRESERVCRALMEG